jgi:hypothetical protein
MSIARSQNHFLSKFYSFRSQDTLSLTLPQHLIPTYEDNALGD